MIIAASPVFAQGKGLASYRVVLDRCVGKFVVYKQYVYEDGTVGRGNGHYFDSHPYDGDEQKTFEKAYQAWLKECSVRIGLKECSVTGEFIFDVERQKFVTKEGA